MKYFCHTCQRDIEYSDASSMCGCFSLHEHRRGAALAESMELKSINDLPLDEALPACLDFLERASGSEYSRTRKAIEALSKCITADISRVGCVKVLLYFIEEEAK